MDLCSKHIHSTHSPSGKYKELGQTVV